MLLAYIDEIGETGAFVSRDHDHYSTSPAFGYAGFIIPEGKARDFGAVFDGEKRTVFKRLIEQADHPGRWERKGAEVFSVRAPETHPGQLRVFDHLVRTLTHMGGNLFYYADEKPIGTPKQTRLDRDDRERQAMREALNRIARHADTHEQNVLVMIDQINEKERKRRLPAMYEHILGRTKEYPEMRRLVEPPMHVDSALSASIQFADWVAACVGRAIDYQLLKESAYSWITDTRVVKSVRGSFTHESKLHLHLRSVGEFHHSQIFSRERPLFPIPGGQLVGDMTDPMAAEKMRAIAAKMHKG
ncbi:DUF3800 domain-containing protein [Brachybacterium sp. p3-SID957]|uniref:DUF3800 domain-containing protein n=1 Tax=Brachybacterium sp. p3-SID957 TaxID=2916049 RepID=UPI00223AE1AA|nr:DUF3800 domain-containing protein [Brachybacterium sp. p3-SID957]MCT1777045.1 DUF3800 domain-containing protein [Brachybacterium sp. p3-SID957]